MFLPGQWDVPTFLFSYFMIGLFPILFFGWKLLKGAKWRKPEEVDLKGEVAEIDEYTRNYVPTPPRYVLTLLSFVRVMEADLRSGMLSTSGLTLSLEAEGWVGCGYDGTYECKIYG